MVRGHNICFALRTADDGEDVVPRPEPALVTWKHRVTNADRVGVGREPGRWRRPVRSRHTARVTVPTTLERPVYGMSQAARLLGLRTDALRRWIDGYHRAGTTYAPVIREEHTGDDTVTWGEFVEAGYLREYRAKQVTLQYLRPVIAILRAELGVRYPLATLQPYTSGRNLALKVQKQVGLDPSLGIVVLGRDGSLQLTDPAQAFLQKVEFADSGTRDARRLYPMGRGVPVVLDPDHGFGEPTLTSGARTEAIAELVAAGEPRDRVAIIYDIALDDVDAAVRYEHDRAA